MEIQIENASATQLAEFASNVLNIEADHRRGKAALITLIRDAGWKDDTIEVDAPVVAKAAPVATADPVNADEAYLNELVTIIIPKDDRENDIVAVGHNGRNIRINRGEISKIPRKYLNVLKDAVKTVYAQTEKDGLGKATQVPMYPYQVIQG